MTHQIASLWTALSRHLDLFAVPDNDKDEQMMEVLRELKSIDSRLFYHIGYRDEGPDFLISAEGHYDLAETISLIVSAAPQLPGWRVRPILDWDALDGRRNEALYPHDENGDVLFGIAEGGGDIITSRSVDFGHVFPSREAAARFADSLPTDEAAMPEPYGGRRGFSWEVIVTRNMVPSHANITSTESRLAELAVRQAGVADGWGFVSN